MNPSMYFHSQLELLATHRSSHPQRGGEVCPFSSSASHGCHGGCEPPDLLVRWKEKEGGERERERECWICWVLEEESYKVWVSYEVETIGEDEGNLGDLKARLRELEGRQFLGA